MNIVGIIGSVFGSKTRIAMENLKFDEDVNFDIIDLSQLTLSFADGRDYRDYDPITAQVVEKILQADALVIATPIYNASIPGALKNVLDLLPIDSIKDKTIGMIITAGSEKHYLVAQYQLLPILDYMKASVVDKYVFITDASYLQGKLADDNIYFRLKALARDITQDVIAIRKEHESRYDF